MLCDPVVGLFPADNIRSVTERAEWEIDVALPADGLLALGNHRWANSHTGLASYDVATGDASPVDGVGGVAAAVAVGPHLWVLTYGELVRIDGTSGAVLDLGTAEFDVDTPPVTGHLHMDGPVGDRVVARASSWVSDHEGEVAVLDADTGQLERSVEVEDV